MNPNTEWQLAGKAAETYERYLVPTIFVPWAGVLLERAGLAAGDNVLDVACGTGIVARLARDKVGSRARICGADLNRDMLEVARSLSSRDGLNIEWIEADVASMPVDDASFDVAFCQQGLQFFPDKTGALREIRRTLRDGGRCIVCVAQALAHNPLMRSQAAAITKHIGGDAAAAIRAVCGLSDGEEIRRLFIDAGFSEVAVESVRLTLTHPDGSDFITNGIASTPLAGLIADWSDEARHALVADILAGFGDHFDGQRLAFPHVSHVVKALN